MAYYRRRRAVAEFLMEEALEFVLKVVVAAALTFLLWWLDEPVFGAVLPLWLCALICFAVVFLGWYLIEEWVSD